MARGQAPYSIFSRQTFAVSAFDKNQFALIVFATKIKIIII